MTDLLPNQLMFHFAWPKEIFKKWSYGNIFHNWCKNHYSGLKDAVVSHPYKPNDSGSLQNAKLGNLKQEFHEWEI